MNRPSFGKDLAPCEVFTIGDESHSKRTQVFGCLTLGLSCCWKRERGTSGRWKQSAPGPCYVDEHGVVKWCLLLPHCRHARERGLMRSSHAVSLDLVPINPYLFQFCTQK